MAASERSVERPAPSASLRLDAAFAALSSLLVLGVALDARAHAQSARSFAEEGFLTPSHVLVYAAFLLVAAVVGAVAYRNRARGASWSRSLPPGYGWAAVGVALFGAGGVGDYFWHRAFGFEQEFQTLTSPTHLALAAGGVLFLAAPLRSALLREERPAGRDAVPAVVSGTLALTGVVVAGAYVNPIFAEETYPRTPAVSVATMAALVAFVAILVGTAIVLDSGLDLPPGALTTLYVGPALASALGPGSFALAVPGLAAGLVGDALVQRRGPLRDRPRTLRAFGALVPLTFAAAYFAAYDLTRGVAWSVHGWAGAILLAGVSGLLVTYVVHPISPRAGGVRAA